jgi:hypothetical protein
MKAAENIKPKNDLLNEKESIDFEEDFDSICDN